MSTLSSEGLDKLRVLTLNIFGQFSNWADRRQVLQRGLADLAPDLIAFQELIMTNEYDQGADLLGSEYKLVHAKQRGPDASGITIASRWPISDVRELVLHISARDDDFPCTTLITEVVVPNPFGPLLFVNHCPDYHPHHEYERELQTVSAARSIEKMIAERRRHVVLAGDFNADTETASIRFLMGKQSLYGASVCYANAWDKIHPRKCGATFTPSNSLVLDAGWDWSFDRIDHVLVRCESKGPTLQIGDCQLAFTEAVDGVWASDHFGVMADLLQHNVNQ